MGAYVSPIIDADARNEQAVRAEIIRRASEKRHQAEIIEVD